MNSNFSSLLYLGWLTVACLDFLMKSVLEIRTSAIDSALGLSLTTHRANQQDSHGRHSAIFSPQHHSLRKEQAKKMNNRECSILDVKLEIIIKSGEPALDATKRGA